MKTFLSSLIVLSIFLTLSLQTYAQNYLCPNKVGHKIALTFDDGPHLQRTPLVLDALISRNTKATFFMLGEKVKANPNLAREVKQRFPIANHGWAHIDYSKASLQQQKQDIESSTSLLEPLLATPWRFRLPYGAGFRGQPQKLVESYGYEHIFWNVDPRDWDANLSQEESFQKIVSATKQAPSSLFPNAHVVVLHDIQAKTAAYIGSWIDRLEEKGHCFVTLGEAL